jgi:hypothetical protein
MSGDRLTTVALLALSCAFALAVWIGRPAAQRAIAPAESTSISSSRVSRGIVLRTLTLPGMIDDVDLGAMPDRLANEAAPAAWQRVITVRGIPGVASVNGPAVIAWTEAGVAYWLTSPTRSTDDLIAIADELR